MSFSREQYSFFTSFLLIALLLMIAALVTHVAKTNFPVSNTSESSVGVTSSN